MTQTYFYPQIEDVLGPSETRFFSAGYRRSIHRIKDIVVWPAQEKRACVEAKVSIEYPRDWSVKSSSMDIKPHLSTVDMILLAIQLSEMHLFYQSKGDPQHNLRTIYLRAGSKPQEALDNISTTVVRKSIIPLAEQSRCLSKYECRAGTMYAMCEFEHAAPQELKSSVQFSSIDDLLGLAQNRYYGEGYKKEKHSIKNIQLDLERLSASADANLYFDDGREDDTIACCQAPGKITFIDIFVICLQISQVMLYAQDRLRREESSTLWMLRTKLTGTPTANIKPCIVPVSVHFPSSQLVALHGNTWRNADISANCGGLELNSSFGYQLPT